MQINKLNIGIVGGAIAGCSVAILLKRLGANVTILERSSSDLIGRGAGIVLPENFTQQCIELNLFDPDISCLHTSSRSFYVCDHDFNENGKKIWRQPLSAYAFNWSDIFSNLRKRVIGDDFHSGEEVLTIKSDNNICHIETTTGKKYQFDLIIAADGIDSIVRKNLLPTFLPNYCGYIAWRGTVDKPSIVNQKIFNQHAPYFVYPNGHILFYLIPNANQQNNNNKLLNWVMFENYNELPLTELLIDKNDKLGTSSIPPGNLSKWHLDHLRQFAKQALPSTIADIICQTEKPFLQAIFDYQTPQYVKDRTCFIGDAATVLRPHSASGVLKALSDSISLAKTFERHDGENLSPLLSEWNEAQHKTAQQQLALAQRMGEALVTATPDWSKMDIGAMEKWWQDVMSGKSWYATDTVKERKA